MTTSYTYDLMSKKTSITNPDSGVARYTYDAAGNITKLQTTNLASNSSIPAENRFIKYTYNFNHLTRYHIS